MSINRGAPVIKRRNARNYTHQEADARLRESVDTYQNQGLNALKVDSFEIKYYHQSRSTTVCTCKETRVLERHAALDSNVPPNIVKQDSVLGTSVNIDYRRQLFGVQSNSIQADDGDMDLDDDLLIDDDEDEETHVTSDSIFASAADCALCYKTGYVPGYSCYGFERILFTTHNINKHHGYFTDATAMPHALQLVDEHNGYIEYLLEIPRYFKDVSYSIRNNKDVLADQIYNEEGHPLTFAEVKHSAGSTIRIYIKSVEFTHVAVEFDLGTDRVLANLAQQQRTIDWTLFSTLGNIQIILPPTIQEVMASDVVYVPTRHVSFKITDVSYLTTSRDRNLDWPVSTRVLQPTEALSKLYRAYKLP